MSDINSDLVTNKQVINFGYLGITRDYSLTTVGYLGITADLILVWRDFTTNDWAFTSVSSRILR